MSESDTIIVLNMEYMNEDPKESKPRVVEETEHEHNFEEEFEEDMGFVKLSKEELSEMTDEEIKDYFSKAPGTKYFKGFFNILADIFEKQSNLLEHISININTKKFKYTKVNNTIVSTDKKGDTYSKLLIAPSEIIAEQKELYPIFSDYISYFPDILQNDVNIRMGTNRKGVEYGLKFEPIYMFSCVK